MFLLTTHEVLAEFLTAPLDRICEVHLNLVASSYRLVSVHRFSMGFMDFWVIYLFLLHSGSVSDHCRGGTPTVTQSEDFLLHYSIDLLKSTSSTVSKSAPHSDLRTSRCFFSWQSSQSFFSTAGDIVCFPPDPSASYTLYLQTGTALKRCQITFLTCSGEQRGFSDQCLDFLVVQVYEGSPERSAAVVTHSQKKLRGQAAKIVWLK